MSEDLAIKVENLSKCYSVFGAPRDRLKQMILPRLQSLAGMPRRQYFREFWALKDVSLEVKKGEAVGILGRNGAGKSTLLQIIAGTLTQTSGTVAVRGRVAALLELGSGFNPEFTGRENVYLGLALQGMSREAIDTAIPRIEEFAEIGDFIDQPLKTYSSGMVMRLAFAVNTSVVPEVMIVDEALSVGDAIFQGKCFARLRQIQGAGCSILFVSHDISVVNNFCQRALWLAKGAACQWGESMPVCRAYEVDCLRQAGMKIDDPVIGACDDLAARGDLRPPLAVATSSSSKWVAMDRTIFQECRESRRLGNGPLEIVNFLIVDDDGLPASSLHWDATYRAVFVLRANQNFVGLFQVALTVDTLEGRRLFHCSDRNHCSQITVGRGREFAALLPMKFPLVSGRYAVRTAVFSFPQDGVTDIKTFDYAKATLSDDPGSSAFISVAPQSNLGISGPIEFDSTIQVVF
jgi:ABC-type polysaccharide/polyol phosphate transport system ATPase subunit